MTDLNQLFKHQWYIEHFDGCPIFTEMAAGFTSKLYGADILVYSLAVVYFKDREGDWCSLVFDQEKIGKFIIAKYFKDKNFFYRLYKRWLKNFNLMLKYYYREFIKDFSCLNNKDLLKWHQEFYKFYKDKVSMPGFLDGFMFYADKRLDSLLREFCAQNNISNYSKIFSILSAPIEPSFIIEEEGDLRKIVKLMKLKPNSETEEVFKKINTNKKLQVLIGQHLLKYSWIKSSYAGHKKYSIQNLKSEIKRIVLNKEKEENKIFSKNKIIKDKLIKKYKFTPEIIAISNLTELFVKWQDQRKIYTLTFVSLQEKFLKELSQRAKIDLELLRYCYSQEIPKILNRKFNKNRLKERQKSSLIIYQNNTVKDIFIGLKAKRFIQQISEVEIKDAKEVVGLVACAGQAEGKVKVVKSEKQINKVQTGDILVTSMTRPNHLIGMKKAAAIVTDDGGITCHAAIVSRELNKPCIIGTRIATKVLKDGDKVEVDAERGVVKVLKRVKGRKNS